MHPDCLADRGGVRSHDPSSSHSGRQGAPDCAEKTRQGCFLVTWDLRPPLRTQDGPLRAGRLTLSWREAITWIFPDHGEAWSPQLSWRLRCLGAPVAQLLRSAQPAPAEAKAPSCFEGGEVPAFPWQRKAGLPPGLMGAGRGEGAGTQPVIRTMEGAKGNLVRSGGQVKVKGDQDPRPHSLEQCRPTELLCRWECLTLSHTAAPAIGGWLNLIELKSKTVKSSGLSCLGHISVAQYRHFRQGRNLCGWLAPIK